MKTVKTIKKNRVRISAGDKLYLGIVYTLLGLFVLCVLYPLLYVVSCSFSSPEALIQGRVFFFPVEPGLQGYRAVFADSRVWTGYINTVYYTVTGTAVGGVVTMCAAYALSRKEFPLKKFLTSFFMVTMFFGGGTIPTYLWLKDLRMLNTVWALILPGACSVWLAIVGRTFIQSNIPEELFEATNLDGGSYAQFFLKVVLPLSKPILAVIALNFALGHWNSYYSAMLYMKDASRFPLQMVLREILIANSIDMTNTNATVDVESVMKNQYLSELLKYSLIIVASIPLLVIYPFIQKYFIKGVLVGSVKG